MLTTESLANRLVTEVARAIAREDINCGTDRVARLYQSEARAAVIAVIERLIGRGKEPVVLKSRGVGETDLRQVLDDLERLAAA